MFVLNLKLNLRKIIIACLSISLLSAMAIDFFTTAKIDDSSSVMTNDSKFDYVLTDSNYLEILKVVHENIDQNVGKTVKLSGFIFRMPDFNETTFVCGKNIIYDGEDSVAGFMCVSDNAKDLIDNEWVELTGIIEKGSYVSDMPVIRIGSIKKIKAPENTFIQQAEE